MESRRLRLNLTDLKRIVRNFLLATLGAAASAAVVSLPEVQGWAIAVIQASDVFAPFVVPVITGLVIAGIDGVRRLLSDYTK